MSDVDRGSQLWATCAHEAAHYLVGLAMEGDPDWPRIIDDERGRVEMEGFDAEEGDEADAAHDYAVFLLAGPACDEVLYGHVSHRSQGDVDNAAELAGEWGADYDEAMDDARDLVDELLEEIEAMADELYIDAV